MTVQKADPYKVAVLWPQRLGDDSGAHRLGAPFVVSQVALPDASFGDESPDVALLPVGVPDALVREILEVKQKIGLRDTPLIVLAGRYDTAQEERALEAGAYGYIVRDASTKAIESRLHCAVESHRFRKASNQETFGVGESNSADVEEGFRALVENASEGILVLRGATPVFANQSFADIHGFESPEDILRLETLGALVAPHDRVRLRNYLDALPLAGDDRTRRDFDTFRRDGTPITVSSTARLIQWFGGQAICVTVVDVTAQRETQAELQATEARLSSLFNNMPHAIALKDTEGHYVAINPANEAIIGLAHDQVAGKVASDLFPPEYAAVIEEDERHVLATGEVTHREATVSFRNEYQTIDIVVFPIRGDAQSIIGVGRISTDLSARRAAETDLRASEARFRAFFENSPHGMCIRNPDLRYVAANEAFTTLHEFEAEDLLGKRAEEVWPNENIKQAFAASRRALEQLDSSEYELTFHMKSGTKQVTLVKFPILDDEKQLLGVGVITSDITEQKAIEAELQAVEARFRAFFENSPHAMCIRDQEQRYVAVNPAYADFHSLQADDIVGKFSEEIWPFQTFGPAVAASQRALEQLEGSEYELNLELDGARKQVVISKFPILDTGRRLLGLGVIWNDVTEQKHAEHHLRKNRQRFADFAEASSDWFWEMGAGLEVLDPMQDGSHRIDPDLLLQLQSPDFDENSSGPADEWRHFWRQLQAQQPVRNKTLQLEGQSGEVRHMRLSCKVVRGEDGEFAGYRGVGTDVTLAVRAQRQAEMLRDAMDGSSGGALLYDETGLVLYTNRKLHEMYPFLPPRLEMPGMTREQLLQLAMNNDARAYPTAAPEAEGPEDERPLTQFGIPQGDQELSSDAGRHYLRRTTATPTGGTLFHFHDITEAKQAQRALEAYQVELRRLASELSLTEERERRRLATELHDGAVQNLGAVKIQLGGLLRQRAGDSVESELQAIREVISQSVRELRSLMSEMSPPMLYELGLSAALEWLTQQFRQRHKLDCVVTVGDQLPKLSNDRLVLLFQSARELLMNVVKHAHAKKVHVWVGTADGLIEVRVIDDGVGMDPDKLRNRPSDSGGFGLFSLRERVELTGGTCAVDIADAGTAITLRVPV